MPRSLRLALLLAGALHGAALAAIASGRLPVAAEAPAPLAERPVELVLLESSAALAPQAAGESKAGDAPRGAEEGTEARSPRSARLAPHEPRAAASGSVEAPPASSAATPGGDPSAEERARRGARAIAALLRGEGPGLAAPESPPGPRAEVLPDRASEALHQSLDEADRQKGLGVGGVCASQAQVAMRMDGAPTSGVGTFEILTDPGGLVTAVSLLDGNAPGFERVRAALLALLRSQRLRVPAQSRGMRVVVRVEARGQMPSGMREGKSFEFEGLGGRFDLADLGARPVRVVSARVVGEQRL